MTFRAVSTGRAPAIFRANLAAGDALIREVAAGQWPRQAAPARGEDAPLPSLRELREIVSPGDGLRVVQPPGDPPPRPSDRDSRPGGADQARDPWRDLDIPPHLRRPSSSPKPALKTPRKR